MEAWNHIINTAMMGTAKKLPAAAELPAALAAAEKQIAQNEQTDHEEKFLQWAALVLAYTQSGVKPRAAQSAPAPAAAPEEKPYCSNAALQVLKDIETEDNIHLLRLWLQQCQQKQLVVQPEALPFLLNSAAQNKVLQTNAALCAGKRGQWLAGFNTAWNFSQNQSNEDRWQTGTPEQRRNVLTEIRTQNPSLAREWVAQTWAAEDAATKTSFLEIMDINIAEPDIPFLESLAAEKSKKVKEEALNLLKKIPASAIVKNYEDVLSKSVFLKKEKALLGLSTKSVLVFQLPADLPADIFKSGIEKLSNDKELTDDAYILFQLIQHVPPKFWEQQLQAGAAEIIHHFQKNILGKKLLAAIVMAVRDFKDFNWALQLMQHAEVFYIELIPMLPAAEQELYSLRFFDQFPDLITEYAINSNAEWSAALAGKIFTHLAKNPYQYNRSFFSQHIALIPAAAAGLLEKCGPTEEYLKNTWINTVEYILKLINIKTQTIKAFND